MLVRQVSVDRFDDLPRTVRVGRRDHTCVVFALLAGERFEVTFIGLLVHDQHRAHVEIEGAFAVCKALGSWFEDHCAGLLLELELQLLLHRRGAGLKRQC
jgi:hypothetical protein